MASIGNLVKASKTRVLDAAGGPARLQVILILAAVLGLDTTQLGTLSAVSDLLKKAFHIDNTQIGMLLAAPQFIGAIATLPMGILADRLSRKYVLIVAVLIWGVAMVISGTATSYGYLIATRVFLGAATACAWPCVASLTGDFFPARDRSAMYGLMLSGEMIGAGIGFFIAGEVGSFSTWQWAFYVMASPSLLIALVLWLWLPEPARGGQSWLKVDEVSADAATRPAQQSKAGGGRVRAAALLLYKKIREADVKPRPSKILHQDPTRWNIWRTMFYLLSLPTYPLLIVASTLAYFYFAGAEAFIMIYFAPHWNLPHSAIAALIIPLGVGALAGLLIGGYLSRWMLIRGWINARIVVPSCALFLSIPFFVVGIGVTRPWIGVPVLVVAALGLGAALAPIDAARLDIVHPRLWGRGEAGRMALRSAFMGGAPLLFGAMSHWLGGGNTTHGLMLTYEIMLFPVLVAACLIVPGLRSYTRDVATVAASVAATEQKKGPGAPAERRQPADEPHPA